MTEEDDLDKTARLLKRCSYEEAVEFFHQSLDEMTDWREKRFEELSNWTLEEYREERTKRNPESPDTTKPSIKWRIGKWLERIAYGLQR